MPIRRLMLPRDRDLGAISNSSLGFYLPAVSVSATAFGGFFTAPQRPPVDWDLSRPVSVFACIAKASGADVPAGVVVFQVAWTYARPGVTAVDVVSTVYVDIPAVFPNQRPTYILLDDPTEPLLPPGTIHPDSIFAIRFARVGSDPADDWTSAILIASCLWLQYSENCHFGCL